MRSPGDIAERLATLGAIDSMANKPYNNLTPLGSQEQHIDRSIDGHAA
jgi:hypothetical protein